MAYGDSEIVTRHDTPERRREETIKALRAAEGRLRAAESALMDAKISVSDIRRALMRERES